MIHKVTGGVNVSFTLTIDGVPVNYESINGIELTLTEDQHDMLTLLVTGLPPRAVTEYRNRAVEFHMNTGGGYSESFVGYVAMIRPTQEVSKGVVNNSPFQVSEVVCLGVSYDMRSKRSVLWPDASIAYITETLAKRYGLSSDAPHVQPFTHSIVQDGESDWKFLVRVAHMHGYRVSVHGTHIYVYNPREAGNRTLSFNRLTTQRISGTASTQAGQIIEFKGDFLEQSVDGVHRDASVTVLQDNNVTYDVTSSEVLRTNAKPPIVDSLNETVHNYEEATKLLQGHTTDKYDYEADILVVGVAGCRPGGLIFLDNYNAEYDGFWYVCSVHHEVFMNGMFTSTLKVKKSLNLEYDMTPKPLGAVPGAVFIDGKWTTRKRIYRVY